MNNRPLLVQALNREPLARPPVWLMRQAGRYQASYRAIKSRHSFLEICRDADIAYEVSMLPINEFDMDAAIVFADILLPLEGLGVTIDFAPGPHIANPIQKPEDMENLVVSEYDAYSVVPKVISRLKDTLSCGESPKAVLGFAGAPWTLACYLIDHGPYKGFQGVPVFAEKHPQAMQTLLDQLTTTTIGYLAAQIAGGADAVQIFDTWGGLLDEESYRRFSLPYITRIINAVQTANTPVILYVNGSNHLLETMEESGARCISLDWRTEPSEALARLKAETVVQGNLDPVSLFAPPALREQKVRSMLESFSARPGYIANLGHGILQETPESAVLELINQVKNYS